MDEARARELLHGIFDDKGLYYKDEGDGGRWLALVWQNNLCPEIARLEGEFVADELEAIAWWMRNKDGD